MFGRKSIATAEKDYEICIVEHKVLEETKRILQRYNTDQLTYAVKFILNKDNVCLFAWRSGKKVIKGTDQMVENFPDCA